jgi:hypothetical protein
MNEEQTKLYNEWLRLEEATNLVAKVGGFSGEYGPVKGISTEDLMNLDLVRKEVWKTLKDFLSLDQKFELGKVLDRPMNEIIS